MIGYQIILGIAIIASLSALFDDHLHDQQKYQQFCAICIASIVCWLIVIVLQLV